MSKRFTDCLCGCGRRVRIYPSKIAKFASRDCYRGFVERYYSVKQIERLLKRLPRKFPAIEVSR